MLLMQTAAFEETFASHEKLRDCLVTWKTSWLFCRREHERQFFDFFNYDVCIGRARICKRAKTWNTLLNFNCKAKFKALDFRI